MDQLILNGIEVECIIGDQPEERESEQRLLVDVALDIDLADAAESDRLEDTVDYALLVGNIRAALEDAALEVDSSIGGTAMLALARLSEIDPHVDRRRLSSRSASLVANPSARLSTRIAAAQLCGLLRVRSALPALLSLSADSSVPTPLRLAAAHAAGLVSESR